MTFEIKNYETELLEMYRAAFCIVGDHWNNECVRHGKHHNRKCAYKPASCDHTEPLATGVSHREKGRLDSG